MYNSERDTLEQYFILGYLFQTKDQFSITILLQNSSSIRIMAIMKNKTVFTFYLGTLLQGKIVCSFVYSSR